jgi:hypothetical protein
MLPALAPTSVALDPLNPLETAIQVAVARKTLDVQRAQAAAIVALLDPSAGTRFDAKA